MPLFHTCARLQRIALLLEACNACFNWAKMTSYLSVSAGFALLTRTVDRAMWPMLNFAGCFAIVFCGFAQAHCMVFHDRVFEFRTLVRGAALAKELRLPRQHEQVCTALGLSLYERGSAPQSLEA